MRLLAGAAVIAFLLLAGTLWARLGAGVDLAVPGHGSPATGAGTAPVDAERAALTAARRSCRIEPLDGFVARQRQLLAGAVEPRRLCLLAEALLERVLARCQLRGMTVGAPLFPTLPAEVARDLDEAERCARQAIQLGGPTADGLRLLAGILSHRIQGLTSALRYNGQIEQALRQAGELEPENAHVHVALGLRKLLAPKFLGHDPAGALPHFEFASRALPDDERPRIFAAMAEHLQHRRVRALHWLEQAVALNPDNVFARVVLVRIRAGEDDPFGRDVTAAEIAAQDAMVTVPDRR